MDIACVKCGEPVDNDFIHEVVEAKGGTYRVVASDFRRRGCPALGLTCSDTPDTQRDSTYGLTRGEAAGILYDILGDDMDGAASMLDEMDF